MRRSAGVLERVDFGVIAAGEFVIAGGDNFPAPHEHRADQRIGTGSAGRFARQTAGQAQIFFVLSARASFGQRGYSLFCLSLGDLRAGPPLRSLINSSNSTMNSLMSLKERYTEAKRT